VSLDHILLGLCRTPHSGYDLKTVFDEAIRYVWNAELSQIYPALKSLEARGLVTGSRAASTRGPARRVYRTTAAGRSALRNWLDNGPAFHDERYAIAAQVFLLDALADMHRSAAFIRRLRAAYGQRRTYLAGIETDGGAAVQPDRLDDVEFHHYLTLRMGLRVLDARIAWCDEALAHITRRTRATRPKNTKKTNAKKR
jgi:DNA-binding PadR family transcriptional regulator